MSFAKMFKANIWLIIFLSITQHALAVSYNQPKFCSNASWHPNAITFVNGAITGSDVFGIFVDTNNTVYVASRTNNEILIWLEGNVNFTKSISVGLQSPFSLFITTVGDIFVDNGLINGRVDKWASNAMNSTVAMYVSYACFGLFIDINDNLYCSVGEHHQVIMKSLDNSTNTPILVGGTGCNGSAADMLNTPHGIFVDSNSNLYVADAGNDRIQFFLSGQSSGITKVGNGTLKYPTGIVLDADEYLFIVDSNNCRIVRLEHNNELRCLAGGFGCDSAPNQLKFPRTLSFDNYGNMFVTDTLNNRIQIFLLASNSCNETTTLQLTITSTVNTDLSTSSLVTNRANNSHSTTVVSYNLPRFCSNVSWNPNGTIFANISIISLSPCGIFVDINNTVYIADRTKNQVVIWFEDSITPNKTISGDLNSSNSLFVTITGDIYVDNSDPNGRVDKWTTNAINSTPMMYVDSRCYSIFVDIDDNLYCSMGLLHQVIMKSFNSSANTSKIVAGAGCRGIASSMLYDPRGIFVDINFNIYVADKSNNRIQFFPAGQRNAKTLAGKGAITSILLNHPIGVMLDADEHLFILEELNNRIIRLEPNGFQCLIGCSGVDSSESDQLVKPYSFSFDSYGNIFVIDSDNSRIQKFLLVTNSCYEATTLKPMITSTANIETSMHISTTLLVTVTKKSENKTTNNEIFSKDSTTSLTSAFNPSYCSNQSQIGTSCNVSTNSCDMLQPCQNTGTCNNTNITLRGYTCLCLSDFNGTNCEIDIRPCKLNTCWNKGICNEPSNTTFNCSCQSGWTGIYCERKINYCKNIKCLNNGVCRSLLLNFTCECLGRSYFGRYCEITATQIVIYQTISKTIGYITILCLIATALFVIIMDVLKYVFGIDLTKDELERIRKRKRAKKRKPPPVIQRCVLCR